MCQHFIVLLTLDRDLLILMIGLSLFIILRFPATVEKKESSDDKEC